MSTDKHRLSTGKHRLSTAFQSPPSPPSRRLPSVAPGERHDDDYFSDNLRRTGSTLADPYLGLKDRVHLGRNDGRSDDNSTSDGFGSVYLGL